MPYKDLEKRRECQRKGYHKNREKIRKDAKERYDKNVERERERSKNYNKKKKEENPEHIRNIHNKWERNRRKNDPTYKIRKNLSRRMRDFLKGKTKSMSTISIVGITSEGLREHIERQWEPWMSWDNYGLYKIDTFNYGWDIDHIIPTSTATTEEELYKLNHYTNLKPLCSKINRDIKRDVIFS
jgi:hypothetical protein